MLWWTLPSIAGTLLSLYIARSATQQMRPPAGYYLCAMGLMVAWWCVGQWASMLWINQDYRYMLAQIQYVAISSVPVLWLSIALSYSGLNRFLLRWYPLFWVVPLTTIVMVMSNEFHNLIWQRFEVIPGSISLDIEYGAWFRVHAVYSYTTVIVATLLLAYRTGMSKGNRSKLIGVLLSPLFVIALNAPFILGINLFPIDPTPAGFALGCSLLLLSLRQNMFSVLPIARQHTLDKLSDGVIVIDDNGRIADCNPAAREILGRKMTHIGSELANAIPGSPELDSNQPTELLMPDGRWLDIRMSQIQGLGGPAKGQVVLIRDISREKSLQMALQNLNNRLEQMAHTDELTGLANRRRLYERAREEWSRSSRHSRPLSIMLIDFDHFKQVNDTFGHQTGDNVLSAAASLLLSMIRPEDLAARHGGEELAILLPDTDAVKAIEAAQRICHAMASLEHQADDGSTFQTTVSVGVATRNADDESPDSLIARADLALYHSKNNGRNIVSVSGKRDHLSLNNPVSPDVLFV